MGWDNEQRTCNYIFMYNMLIVTNEQYSNSFPQNPATGGKDQSLLSNFIS